MNDINEERIRNIEEKIINIDTDVYRLRNKLIYTITEDVIMSAIVGITIFLCVFMVCLTILWS